MQSLYYDITPDAESNWRISFSNVAKVAKLELFLKEKKQKYPGAMRCMYRPITEYPRLRHLFLSTALRQPFLEIEKENLLGTEGSSEILATKRKR